MRLSPRQSEALRLVAEGRFYPDLVKEDDGWYARWRAFGDDGNSWVDEFVRRAVMSPLTRHAEDRKHETLHDAWMAALRSETGLVRWDDAECAEFAGDLAEWHGGGEEDVAVRKSITFRLVQPPEAGGKFRIVCATPKGPRALKALGQASYIFGALRGLARSGDGGELCAVLSRAEAETFVAQGARELVEAGYSVEGVEIAAAVTASAEVDGDAATASSQKTPFKARLKIHVAGEEVSAEEIRFLLEQGSSLVFFRNRWIEVNRNVLKEALRALEKSGLAPLSRVEAIAFASGIGRIGRLEMAGVAAHGWLRGFVNQLRAAGRAPLGDMEALELGELGAALRDYQRRGVAWLKFLTDNGFGALLADDMGLGKTLQTIGWIVASGASARPVLVVAPLTLLANWRHEFAKFAPGLRVAVHQGDGREHGIGFRRVVGASDVVVTSYSILVKDYREISEVEWGGLVLDEAQTIKNADTQAARAVRALGVKRRVALTGTPVENSAADVWSIEEYLNPGFLGDRASFAERFLKPIAYEPCGAAAKRLRHALEPFVLRRLKGDAGIAGELGPKREIREYCALSPEERGEYEAALADFRASDRRQGDVFALITRLKLICDGTAGGKFARLVELVESIFAAGESALVFTQYAKVGAELKAALEARFGRRVQFLHGGLSAKERERQIASFNRGTTPSLFVLSLRAGGFGLNLVKAAHVIHYDRWWNPAVENQATDRAHRIGQTKTVFVHLMITEGTLEERVDDILQSKSALASSLITGGESFLMKLSAQEFDDVVALS